MHDGGTAEARSWLARADGFSRCLSESSKREIWDDDLLKIVDELYAAGAICVWADGIEAGIDFEDASWLIMDLPSEPAKRAKVILVYNRLLRDLETIWDPETEHGQDSLRLGW